jgi:hypothetical protein
MSTHQATPPSAVGSAARIDPRGPQFAAALTSVVLAAVLLLAPRPVAVVLLAAQVVVFAVGAGRGVQHTPYAWLFKTLVRPRLGAPGELEDAAPPRFAQAVGLGFGVVALAGSSPVPTSSASSPPASPSRRRCSTRSSGSAWAASCT